jgi:RNA polymerase sigma factor (TIGR02999 family)
MSEITLLLSAAQSGSRHAAGELLPLVYDELRHIASSHLAAIPPGQTIQATALVHEAWLRLVGDEHRTWENRTHFFRAAALAMRRILVDLARAKHSLKRFHGSERIDISEVELSIPAQDDRVLLVNEALDRLALMDPEGAELVTLKFFGGFTNQQIAKLRGVTERTIERQWVYIKASLYTLISEERNAPAVQRIEPKPAS